MRWETPRSANCSAVCYAVFGGAEAVAGVILDYPRHAKHLGDYPVGSGLGLFAGGAETGPHGPGVANGVRVSACGFRVGADLFLGVGVVACGGVGGEDEDVGVCPGPLKGGVGNFASPSGPDPDGYVGFLDGVGGEGEVLELVVFAGMGDGPSR